MICGGLATEVRVVEGATIRSVLIYSLSTLEEAQNARALLRLDLFGAIKGERAATSCGIWAHCAVVSTLLFRREMLAILNKVYFLWKRWARLLCAYSRAKREEID